MIEFLAINWKVPNFQFCMISWKLTRTSIVSSERIIDGHFWDQKVTKEECKDPLAWWKACEVHYSYVGFVSSTNFGDYWFSN